MKEKRKTTRRKINTPVMECFFCKEKKEPDFMESEILSRYTSERGKILARSKTGLCSKHQRKLTEAIKRARHLALLPFVVRPD